MSKLMKLTIIQVVTWTLVAIGMVLIFTSNSTIGEWGDQRAKTLLLAVLFLIGYGTDFTIRFIEKSSKWGVKRDERDRDISYKAVTTGFVLLMLYLFTLCISLYVYYEESGYVPIAWIWFIAYSTIVVANLSSGYASLYFYRKQGN